MAESAFLDCNKFSLVRQRPNRLNQQTADEGNPENLSRGLAQRLILHRIAWASRLITYVVNDGKLTWHRRACSRAQLLSSGAAQLCPRKGNKTLTIASASQDREDSVNEKGERYRGEIPNTLASTSKAQGVSNKLYGLKVFESKGRTSHGRPWRKTGIEAPWELTALIRSSLTWQACHSLPDSGNGSAGRCENGGGHREEDDTTVGDLCAKSLRVSRHSRLVASYQVRTRRGMEMQRSMI